MVIKRQGIHVAFFLRCETGRGDIRVASVLCETGEGGHSRCICSPFVKRGGGTFTLHRFSVKRARGDIHVASVLLFSDGDWGHPGCIDHI